MQISFDVYIGNPGHRMYEDIFAILHLCHFFIVNGIISSTLQNRQGKQLHLQKCVYSKFTPQHVCLGNLVQTSQRKSNNLNIF